MLQWVCNCILEERLVDRYFKHFIEYYQHVLLPALQKMTLSLGGASGRWMDRLVKEDACYQCVYLSHSTDPCISYR